MEEQLIKEAKLGWRFAADSARITDESQQRRLTRLEICRRSARITDEKARCEDRKHTSGGVFCINRQQSGSRYWQ